MINGYKEYESVILTDKDGGVLAVISDDAVILHNTVDVIFDEDDE